jgi:hypothetical protein
METDLVQLCGDFDFLRLPEHHTGSLLSVPQGNIMENYFGREFEARSEFGIEVEVTHPVVSPHPFSPLQAFTFA